MRAEFTIDSTAIHFVNFLNRNRIGPKSFEIEPNVCYLGVMSSNFSSQSQISPQRFEVLGFISKVRDDDSEQASMPFPVLVIELLPLSPD